MGNYETQIIDVSCKI